MHKKLFNFEAIKNLICKSKIYHRTTNIAAKSAKVKYSLL